VAVARLQSMYFFVYLADTLRFFPANHNEINPYLIINGEKHPHIPTRLCKDVFESPPILSPLKSF
jgi:hypothetical protein